MQLQVLQRKLAGFTMCKNCCPNVLVNSPVCIAHCWGAVFTAVVVKVRAFHRTYIYMPLSWLSLLPLLVSPRCAELLVLPHAAVALRLLLKSATAVPQLLLPSQQHTQQTCEHLYLILLLLLLLAQH
jgi:hypothetical protein